MQLRPTSVLLHIKAVEALTGKHPDTIYAMADGGDLIDGGLRWVFDLSVNGAEGRNRDLRFFTSEVIAPELAKKFSLAKVLGLILPEVRANFQSGEVERLLVISGNTLGRLRLQMGGELAHSTSFFPRLALADFLTSRWLGCAAALANEIKETV